MVRTIDIKHLNMDELLGVVSIYPWYAGARMELCRRLSEAGTLSRVETGQAALYMGSRRLLFDLLRETRGNYSDTQVSSLLAGVLGGGSGQALERQLQLGSQPLSGPLQSQSQLQPGQIQQSGADAPPHFFVVGGDYFSAAQYREVRRSEDTMFSSFASADREDLEFEEPEEGFDLCTETLAGIYAEQGYLNEAKQIYSKLSLRYPEKSVYFAALIEKLDKN